MDLHVHTCLSPCGDLAMLPGQIAARARRRGLDAIGIADHNSAENVAAVRNAAGREGVAVVGAMEVTSEEEVHVLALFDDDASLSGFQRVVYDNLPGVNDERAFGEQVLVDERDEVTGINDRLLIGATTLSVDEVVDAIHSLGGVAVAAHVDRERFGIIGQLGFIPDGLALDGVELATKPPPGVLRAYGFPAIVSSDAHFLEDIGRNATVFRVEEATAGEVGRALRNEDGRSVIAYS
ncbi:PHP domain-containing protein [candidate division WOR-3 bacterium]|nr:PHP domain-containing protein [candidate division WOR-3 bacterium]